MASISPEIIEDSGYDIVIKVWEKVAIDTSIEEKAKMEKAFFKGYNNRPSVRVSNKTGTKPDIVIDRLLKARIEKLSEKDIRVICFGHRLSMAAENIIGLILEEYIHELIRPYGWSCCWGNSIRAVDFCSNNNDLLQVKNKSNTENSSSSKIRDNTEIRKWYRLNARTGKSEWNSLNAIIGTKNLLSEKGFQDFATRTLIKNPSALYVDEAELEEISALLTDI